MIKKILTLALILAPMSLFAQKFAHFNYAEIMQSLPEYRTAVEELDKVRKQYAEELASMENEIRTKYEKYQKEVTDQTPQNIVATKQKEISDLQERYEQAGKDYTDDFQQQSAKKQQPIRQKVANAINEVVKAGGYTYAIDTNSAQENGIIINEGVSEDITKRVMDKLGITAADIAAGKKAAAEAAAAAQQGAQ